VNHREVGRYWDENADAWVELERAGYNVYREYLNNPAFLDLLPDVKGLRGLDIGCGPAHTTRLVAERAGQMVGLDISRRFLGCAIEQEREDPRGIQFVRASAVELPLSDESFDFAIGTMSFMDMPELERVIAEVHRVLRPGGFLQFSILHPCFSQVKQGAWVRDSSGRRTAFQVAGYWDREQGRVEEWTFSAAPREVQERVRPFRIPCFDRTLADWLNLLVEGGFVLERVCEPRMKKEQLHERPDLYETEIVPWFIQFRWRKPGSKVPS
jgi:ubiquinone/menaquinone biosynthesis C-methylase UbiE